MATIFLTLSKNPEEFSFDAFYILQRFNLPEHKQLKIYELIKTSDWYEKLSTLNNDEIKKSAQDVLILNAANIGVRHRRK